MFKLKEAMDYASEVRGKKVTNKEIGNLLFADSNPRSMFANVQNLMYGITKRIEFEQVEALTSYLGVSADFLFGLTDNPKPISLDELKAKVNELNEYTKTL